MIHVPAYDFGERGTWFAKICERAKIVEDIILPSFSPGSSTEGIHLRIFIRSLAFDETPQKK